MTREEYLKAQAIELLRHQKKIDKINERIFNGNLTQNATEKAHNDLNWECMYKEQTRERIGFALGFIGLDELRDNYQPSAWHNYKGIRSEMEKLKFD